MKSALIVALAAALPLTALQQVYDVSDTQIVPPRVVRAVKAQYTPEAIRAGLEGRVVLAGVVRPDGSVDTIGVVQSLDPGLDRQAVAAFGQWEFSPGTRDGTPVAVRVHCEIAFTLK